VDGKLIFEDMRVFLKKLEDEGELVRIKEEIDAKYEIGAYLRKTSDISGPALLFEKVRGYQMPVVGGLMLNRKKAILALGSTSNDVLGKVLRGIQEPLPTKPVTSGPCQEVVMLGDQVELGKLPVPIYNPKDGGPYITVGVAISRDPETRTKNASIYRLQVKGKNKLGIMAQQFQHVSAQFAKAEEDGKPLEIAVALGLEPTILIASQVKAPYGVDELTIAGGIRGEPLQVVKCRTVDLEVPSASEIIIEGKILPGIREEEGPFGEFTGHYGIQDKNPVIEVTALTHRKNPIFQACLTGMPTTEEQILKEIPCEASLFQELKKDFPEITNIHVSPIGGSIFLVIIALKQRYKGEAKQIILAALGTTVRPKYVIVVDDDIDIFNYEKVLWAIIFRAQPAEDFLIASGIAGGPLDPSVLEKDVTSVVGIDATRPHGRPFPEVINIPGLDKIIIPKPRRLEDRT
jgi:2,5-furandicarboxylate decarboxylase 1